MLSRITQSKEEKDKITAFDLFRPAITANDIDTNYEIHLRQKIEYDPDF